MFSRKHEIPHMGDASKDILAILPDKVKAAVEFFSFL